jgi:hypothetical protein
MLVREKCAQALRVNAESNMLTADFRKSGEIVGEYLQDMAIEFCEEHDVKPNNTFLMIPYYSGTGVAFIPLEGLEMLDQAILEMACVIMSKMEVPASICVGIVAEAAKFPKEEMEAMRNMSSDELDAKKAASPNKTLAINCLSMCPTGPDQSYFMAGVFKLGTTRILAKDIEEAETHSLSSDNMDRLKSFGVLLPFMLTYAEKFLKFYRSLASDSEIMDLVVRHQAAEEQTA